MKEKQLNKNIVNEGHYIVDNLDHAYVIDKDDVFQFRLLDRVTISLSHRRKTQPILEIAPQYYVPHVPMSPSGYPAIVHTEHQGQAAGSTPAEYHPGLAPSSPHEAHWEGTGKGPQLISTPLTAPA